MRHMLRLHRMTPNDKVLCCVTDKTDKMYFRNVMEIPVSDEKLLILLC